MAKSLRLRPSKRLIGIVDRAMFWNRAARTWGYHGPQANLLQRRLKDRALRARRLLLAEIAKLEAQGIVARDMLRRARQ